MRNIIVKNNTEFVLFFIHVLFFLTLILYTIVFYMSIYLLKIPKFCTVSNSHCVNLYTFFILLQHFFYQIIVFYTSF